MSSTGSPDDINNPLIVAELAERFAAYDRALDANDVDALNAFFLDSETTVRFGMAENLFGHAAIASYRAAARPTGALPARGRTVISSFGRDFGTVATTSQARGSGRATRTMQTWVRFAIGWRIVGAHVSLLAER